MRVDPAVQARSVAMGEFKVAVLEAGQSAGLTDLEVGTALAELSSTLMRGLLSQEVPPHREWPPKKPALE